jgi:hypothetical protein
MCPTKPDHGDGWCEMPQGHNTVGGIWEDAQMVFPSPLLGAAIHRGEVTNLSSIASVVDPVCCGRFIVRNNADHVRQAAMPGLGDVSTDARNQGVR